MVRGLIRYRLERIYVDFSVLAGNTRPGFRKGEPMQLAQVILTKGPVFTCKPLRVLNG
jgi:hypothetical protein